MVYLLGLVHNIEEKIQPLIVPAILEHEEVPGIGGNKMTGFRGRTSSLRDVDSPGGKQKPIDALLQELTSHYKVRRILRTLTIYVILIILTVLDTHILWGRS